MNCEMVSRSIPLYFYGELSLEDEGRIEDHLEACAACRQELDRHKRLLQALDRRALDPPACLLAECREDLMRAVYHQEAPSRTRSTKRAWPLLQQGFGILLAPISRFRVPLGAAALLALGFFSARLTMLTPPAPSVASGLPDQMVISTVRSVQPDASGQVHIAIDETRRRVVSGSPEDRMIQRLLLAGARDENNPGVRVEAVDLLKDHPVSEEVRAVLAHAAAHDPNPGVRLKALEGLKPYAADPQVRQALAQVLLQDENPSVRIHAIDMLTARPDDSMVGVLQNLVQKENNSYVRLRIEKALVDMNASVGTF